MPNQKIRAILRYVILLMFLLAIAAILFNTGVVVEECLDDLHFCLYWIYRHY